MSDLITQRLWSPAFHTCSKCLRTVTRGVIGTRVERGTRVTVLCHNMVSTVVIPDIVVEDSARYWHFLDDEGKPYETAHAKRKRLLGEELQREIARRAAREEE